MSVLAVYNSKGGVGKTTTAVNLAWTSAHSGRPTLLWDLDPQGAVSYFLKDLRGLEQSTRKLLSGKKDWQDEIRPTGIGGLSLIPGDGTLRHWDLLLGEQAHGRRLLQEWLKPLRQKFSVILLDCPPGLTLLTENLFRAADTIVMPVVPSALSFRTLDQVKGFLADSEKESPPILPFLSMVDRRKKDHRQWSDQPPEGFLKSWVPLLTEIEKMIQPELVLSYRRTKRSWDVYQNLWDEIQLRSGSPSTSR
jgi:cellulose biosynthesis protein BcsQ